MQKQIIIISCSFLGLLIIFFILIHANTPAAKQIPIVGYFVPSPTSTSVQTSVTTDSGVNVGAQTGSNAPQPVTGSHLHPENAYRDGIYIGSSASPKGVLEIQIKIVNNTLKDISFLLTPASAPTDVLHSLALQAIKLQAVEVSPINGYDDISISFQTALGSAMQKAFKNSP